MRCVNLALMAYAHMAQLECRQAPATPATPASGRAPQEKRAASREDTRPEEKTEVDKERALLERERAVWAEERERERAVWAEERSRDGDAREALDMCRKEVGLLKREVYAVKYVVKCVVKYEQEVECIARREGFVSNIRLALLYE